MPAPLPEATIRIASGLAEVELEHLGGDAGVGAAEALVATTFMPFFSASAVSALSQSSP